MWALSLTGSTWNFTVKEANVLKAKPASKNVLMDELAQRHCRYCLSKGRLRKRKKARVLNRDRFFNLFPSLPIKRDTRQPNLRYSWHSRAKLHQIPCEKRSQSSCSCVTGAQIRPDLWHDNRRLVRPKGMSGRYVWLQWSGFLLASSPSLSQPRLECQTTVEEKLCRLWSGRTAISVGANLCRRWIICHCVCFTCPDTLHWRKCHFRNEFLKKRKTVYFLLVFKGVKTYVSPKCYFLCDCVLYQMHNMSFLQQGVSVSKQLNAGWGVLSFSF